MRESLLAELEEKKQEADLNVSLTLIDIDRQIMQLADARKNIRSMRSKRVLERVRPDPKKKKKKKKK